VITLLMLLGTHRFLVWIAPSTPVPIAEVAA
jgi:hypothetical protein